MLQRSNIGNSVLFTGSLDGEDQRPDASVDPTVDVKKKSQGKKGMYEHYVDQILLTMA
jgi:hypothetical protein